MENLKNGTRFREMEKEKYYIVKDRKLWLQEDKGIYDSRLENIQIMYGAFELLKEDEEIDIDSIEEFKFGTMEQTDNYFTRSKINELIKAIKQLNKKIGE